MNLWEIARAAKELTKNLVHMITVQPYNRVWRLFGPKIDVSFENVPWHITIVLRGPFWHSDLVDWHSKVLTIYGGTYLYSNYGLGYSRWKIYRSESCDCQAFPKCFSRSYLGAWDGSIMTLTCGCCFRLICFLLEMSMKGMNGILWIDVSDSGRCILFQDWISAFVRGIWYLVTGSGFASKPGVRYRCTDAVTLGLTEMMTVKLRWMLLMKI